MDGLEISVILVDDELQALAALEQKLVRFPELKVVGQFNDSSDAIKAILEMKPGLLFLDIQMPGKDGFSVVKEIHEDQYSPEVIFVSAYHQFAIKALRNSALDFLVKPVLDEELEAVVTRLLQKVTSGQVAIPLKPLIERLADHLPSLRPAGRIKFASGSGFVMIHPDDMVYIQADWNYSEIWLSHGSHEMLTLNLGNVEKLLPAGQFFRINRSIIINLAYLWKVNRKKRVAILKKDGEEFSFAIPLLNIRKLERFLET
jgi:two-component system, LytTR family, response regulator